MDRDRFHTDIARILLVQSLKIQPGERVFIDVMDTDAYEFVNVLHRESLIR